MKLNVLPGLTIPQKEFIIIIIIIIIIIKTKLWIRDKSVVFSGKSNIVLNSFSSDCKNSEVFTHFEFMMTFNFVMKSSTAGTTMKFANIVFANICKHLQKFANIVFSTKVNLLYILYSTSQSCCLLHLIKQNCLLKTFLRTLILMTQVFLCLFSLLELI